MRCIKCRHEVYLGFCRVCVPEPTTIDVKKATELGQLVIKHEDQRRSLGYVPLSTWDVMVKLAHEMGGSSVREIK